MYLVMLAGALVALNLDAAVWRSINDNVMGGISVGQMMPDEEGLRFSGRLSLDNNGGFSSVRRLVTEVPNGASAVRLRVRGDGRTYQFRLRQDRNFDGIAWRSEFVTSGDWQTLELPLADFEPVFRGRRVSNADDLQPERIRQIGFMIADKTAGDFSLRIASIEWSGAGSESAAR